MSLAAKCRGSDGLSRATGSSRRPRLPKLRLLVEASSNKQQQQQEKKQPQQKKQDGSAKRVAPTGLARRFQDGLLIMGDVVMVLATEASSDRIPLSQMPMLAGVVATRCDCALALRRQARAAARWLRALPPRRPHRPPRPPPSPPPCSWVLCGAIVGDYTFELFTDVDDLAIAAGLPTFLAILNASVTWGLSTLLCLGAYSWMVSNWMVEAATVIELQDQAGLPPQLEVSVALLVVMTTWRGIATLLRM
jgi:hypothetical protein